MGTGISTGKPTPQDYALVFADHKVGAAILEDLVSRFARGAVTTGGIDAILRTYQNDGRRQVIDFIVSQVNRAHNVSIDGEYDGE